MSDDDGSDLVEPLSRPAGFAEALPFSLDEFQIRAMEAVDRGDCVVVSAPTGSGKTLIAGFAISCARQSAQKSFYTTPLKALSNQKYAELVAEHGEERVGLLTGDSAIRAHADIVVMTTEVLRNMLLTASPLLEGLGTVILDEVHFIQDPYRGGVWEEVLILTPATVQFVCLSATVANAGVLGEWIRSLRGETSVIVERRRPISLRNHLAVTPRGGEGPILIDLLEKERVSEQGLRIDQANRRKTRSKTWSGSRQQGPPRPHGPPRRSELLEMLDERRMLPAIVFIFSRAGCEEAVRQLLRDGVRLVNRSDRARIRAIAEHYVDEFDDDELDALGYGHWVEGLESGLAAHHAGLVPAFREAVEVCFSEGLLGVVFATETLSLGINMPARTVVLERFSKFGGAGRAPLTSGEYAQLTGRAGRRGLDAEGHAVVCFSHEISVSEIARVAIAPPPDLHSSFRPTYNLACNLMERFNRDEALALLSKTFAQFEVDHHHFVRRRSVAETFARRLAVLEELGYIRGWMLTEHGQRLRSLYHEADLLLAQSMVSSAFESPEPALLAGLLSALIFEPRRARHLPGGSTPKRSKKQGALPDRLGQARRQELDERLVVMQRLAESIHQVEEIHLVPHCRHVEPGLATAVASWARGASLATTLAVAARDVGEVAPGDFVRVLRQVADLADQLRHTASDAGLAESARILVPQLLRSVVASGGPLVSASPGPIPL
jgi:superfamily II RNA helicase